MSTMTSSSSDCYAPARSLWLNNQLPPDLLTNLKLSENPDPAVDSSFRIGSVSQTSIGLSALAAAYFHTLRTGVEQEVSVDARHATLEFKSEMWYTVEGKLSGSGSLWDPIAGLYKTGDGTWVRVHTNFPHHRQGILDILGCEATRESVQSALLNWNAVEFEKEAASRNMCATALRSFDQWDKHPQALALANMPPVYLVKIGEAPKREIKGDFQCPLDGIRVLDLTRVLAGPTCGRTLAAHGADVLLVTSANLPDLPQLDIDTSRGKRTTQLDLALPSDREKLISLTKDADVFLQGYRPNGLREKGFGPEDLAQARPGIVCANLCAYGWEGPWKDRRGFDSLVQTATGFNVAEGRAYANYMNEEQVLPRPLPMQAIDHASGYLLAFGINAALCKTVTEGGSWEVRVSLASVGQWIRSLGLIDAKTAFGQGPPIPPRTLPQHPEIADLAVTFQESVGDKNEASEPRRTMTAVRHAAILSKTPVKENEAPMGLDRNTPTWL
ncbi:hypothetical protein SERLA73DRAFT_109507 [Serpula lacrymans var. lacrymans S7.3]|uniref:CoA-transferase family III n=2 Tax=Serpula lacrymans var. lacrymans TaxID=341189 RepID=F8Q1G8_SERL3|nr:uncharacterized protein SERLADRAFT_416095 [Serpula lacrymans var. lacrymans S7.9]EGN98146.1 hypothetical protein SERLA73DRAFT_109507 [Serpula lacrymans var. lacrymans S7.3]EGO23722.1 hypothetical protein SERLADRAFT_416095 [Serpula lacrymans var. lacrymans S7.9]